MIEFKQMLMKQFIMEDVLFLIPQNKMSRKSIIKACFEKDLNFTHVNNDRPIESKSILSDTIFKSKYGAIVIHKIDFKLIEDRLESEEMESFYYDYEDELCLVLDKRLDNE